MVLFITLPARALGIAAAVAVVLVASGCGGSGGSSGAGGNGYVYLQHATGPATVSGGWPSLAYVTRTLGGYLRDNLLEGDSALESFYCQQFAPPPSPVDDCVAKFSTIDGSTDWHDDLETGGHPDGSFGWEDDSSGTQTGIYEGGTLP